MCFDSNFEIKICVVHLEIFLITWKDKRIDIFRSFFCFEPLNLTFIVRPRVFDIFYWILKIIVNNRPFEQRLWKRWVKQRLKSDFNEVLFVLESGELQCKIIKITPMFILEKDSTHKTYFNNNHFWLSFSGLILMKWTQSLF